MPSPNRTKKSRGLPEEKRGPKYKISGEKDWAKFDELCVLACTLKEIASVFRCDVNTVEDAVMREKGCKFSEYWRQRADEGNISLRRAQLRAAIDGNVTMQIWLGKQKLRQGNEGPIEEKVGPSIGSQDYATLLHTIADLIKQQQDAPIIPDDPEEPTT